MEPAGVEPASANRSISASTCVFRRSVFLVRSSAGEPPIPDQSQSSRRMISRPSHPTSPIRSTPHNPPRPGLIVRRAALTQLSSQDQFRVGTYRVLPLVYDVTAPPQA